MPNILLHRTGALGDVLEVTAVARRLKSLGASVFVHTNYPQVWLDSPDAQVADYYTTGIEKVFDLNMAFERDLRRNHPIDSFSRIVFGDTNTEHKIYFNFPKSETLVINGEPMIQPVAVLHPAKSWPIRTFSQNFWQTLIHKLNDSGFATVLTGTRQDHSGLTDCFDLRSTLSLQQQASLIDFSSVFICSESGPMILAQATKAPIIALLTMVPREHILHDRDASTNTIITIPANVKCIGCAARQPTAVTYFDCEHGPTSPNFRRCVRDSAFDIDQIAKFATTLGEPK